MGSVGENVSGLGEGGSMQSCEPSSTVKLDCPQNVVVALNADGNAGKVGSVWLRNKSSRRRKVEKDVVGGGLVMKTGTQGRPSRRCKKMSNEKMPLDLSCVEFAGRRRRSLNKPRMSDWGSLATIEHILKQSADADLNQNEPKNSRTAGGSEEDVKPKNDQTRASSLRSKKEIPTSTSRIRLKVTFGGSCSSKIMPGVVDDHRSSCLTLIRSASDGHDDIATQKQVEVLETVDSRCLDPGTSPDSEVINVIPDIQTSEKIAEDDILNKEICVVSGEVSSSTLPVASTRKGIKKNICCQDVNCSICDKPPSPEIIDSTRVADQHRHSERTTDNAMLSEAYMSTTTGKIPAKTSSSGQCFMEPPLPSSELPDFGDSAKEGKVFLAGGLCSPVRFQHENSKKFVPSTELRDHKNTKSPGSPKGSLECSQTVPPEAGSDEQNRDLFDLKAKEKSDHAQAVCKNENSTEAGGHTFIDHGESKTGCSTTLDVTYIKLEGALDEYVPPRNAWVSCDNCYKWRRIPATLADSIEDTKSSWICKDNVDKDFADCSIPQEKSNAEINAELDISDASGEEDAGATLHMIDKLEKKKATVSKHSWKLIRSNHFLHRTRKTQTIDEIMVCHCKAPLGGRTGCGNGCLNRMLNIECVKGTCPCGELCSNNQFQKRNYAKLKCFRCGKKGHGLQLLEDIREGQFLIEYVGEVLDMHAYEDRQKEYALKGHRHFYFMTLNGSEVIDACAKGNLGRFINHSCEPNCRTEKWMVNGEVCIGLFALRDIKKGEEVTFDYNYVRVFGAAAKKCVCGSSMCRGYIGDDPSSDEIILQDDSDEENLESLTVCEDSDDNLDNVVSTSSSVDIDVTDMCNVGKDVCGKAATDVERLKATAEIHAPYSLSRPRKENHALRTAAGCTGMSPSIEESMQKPSSADPEPSVVEMDSKVGLTSSMQAIDTSMQLDDGESKIMLVSDEIANKSLGTTQSIETATTKLGRSSIDKTDTQRKFKYGVKEDRNVVSASPLITKTSHSPSSSKKGKLQKSDVLVKNVEIGNKLHQLSYKSNKLVDSSSSDPFEAVQVKLNELLNAEGGISKRKDASKGYLKLLFLTAASGDSGNGEAIQSNRDLSMILDALLKTQSRTVLADIINKNGLQMLHNIMKRCRKEFHKIPILRKLLKVIEYLAVREILTLEHITTGPRCVGVESFRESILSLTEHDDKQVHKIARSFRDKWIPRHLRKNNYMDRDTSRMDFYRGASNCNRLSAVHSQSLDLGGRRPESVECIKQPESGDKICCENLDSCSASCSNDCVANKTSVGKRKSGWDQPAESGLGIGASPHKEPRIHPGIVQVSKLHPRHGINGVWSNQAAIIYEEKHTNRSVNHSSHRTKSKDLDDNRQNIGGDAPPGFYSPRKDSLVSSSASSTAKGLHLEKCFCPEYPYEGVVGHPQERFISRMPVSFGIPLHAVEQFGRPLAETAENLAVAAGIPFHPYPPLPSYGRERRGSKSASCSLTVKSDAVVKEEFQICATYQSDHNTSSTSAAATPDLEHPAAIKQHNSQGTSGASNCLERKYFRQQRWSNTKFSPPWVRSRLGGGNFGYGPRNGDKLYRPRHWS